MARVSAQDCLERLPNHFALCILGARRARELAVHAEPPPGPVNRRVIADAREDIVQRARRRIRELQRLRVEGDEVVQLEAVLVVVELLADPARLEPQGGEVGVVEAGLHPAAGGNGTGEPG